MTKILLAIGLGSALMLAPAIAFADDAAAPKPDATAPMAPKPMMHHHHHHHKVVVVIKHHHHHHHMMMKKPMMKPADKPADAPKS
jgi:hypothetical protein